MSRFCRHKTIAEGKAENCVFCEDLNMELEQFTHRDNAAIRSVNIGPVVDDRDSNAAISIDTHVKRRLEMGF
jgi:hypothetical protein